MDTDSTNKYEEKQWKKFVRVKASRIFPIAWFYLRQLGFKKEDDLEGRIVVDREKKTLVIHVRKRKKEVLK